MTVQHRINRPHDAGSIEVYGDESYEWRIIDHTGHLVRDSANEGQGPGSYSSPELALRDAIAFDADDNVVPIFFRHGVGAALENAAQAHRTTDKLQAIALALKSAVSQALLESRHATDGEAQDYLEARIVVMQHMIQELEESAGRMRTISGGRQGGTEYAEE